jgi:hypothetical protein
MFCDIKQLQRVALTVDRPPGGRFLLPTTTPDDDKRVETLRDQTWKAYIHYRLCWPKGLVGANPTDSASRGGNQTRQNVNTKAFGTCVETRFTDSKP